VDFLFPDRPRENDPPWRVAPETLTAIDIHFWDWILWLAQKDRREPDGTAGRLAQMYKLMLGPMGVQDIPTSISAAVAAYVRTREELERQFAVDVSRRLGHDVLERLRAVGY